MMMFYVSLYLIPISHHHYGYVSPHRTGTNLNFDFLIITTTPRLLLDARFDIWQYHFYIHFLHSHCHTYSSYPTEVGMYDFMFDNILQ